MPVKQDAPEQASVSAMFANCWFMNWAVMAFSRYCVGAVELSKLARISSGAAAVRIGAESARERTSIIDAAERGDIYVD